MLEEKPIDNITVVNDKYNYYNGDIYWNNYEQVSREINLRTSNDALKPYFLHFKQMVKGRTFSKALILNCGNGWVEREMFQHSLFEEAVGVDIQESSLQQAQHEAEILGMPARYYRMDINSDIFQENDFDLVVNHAAAHHIAYLDRVFLALARTLPENGYFIHFDYVGPHRNQYSLEQWNAAILLNQKLPSHMRSAMQYPSHYAMLHSDPTEAIHSELIIPTLRRYFEIIDQKHAGGALAYLILSHNSNFQIGTPEEQAHYLGMIIEADRAYLEQYPDSSLFDYIVAKPDKTRLDEQSTDKYLLEEDERERKSLQNQGHYYEQHWFQKLNGDLDKQERELAYLRLLKDELDWRTHQLQGVLSELEALRNTRTVKLSKALGNFLNRLRPRG